MRPRRLVHQQTESPIGATYALLALRSPTRSSTLLDLAQAAPAYPPAPEVVEHIAAVARAPHGGTYTEIEGLPRLREAFAEELRHDYGGTVEADNVVVTAGCNQAFCLVASALAGAGDEVVLPLPYYFNHDMWLRMNGITPVYVEPGPDLVPTIESTSAAITRRTRAIVLVTPGNPSGVTMAPERLAAFAGLAADRGVALVVDETYRSFRGTDAPAHRLFADAAWTDTVISLHSFSKDLAIPGYRVGAVVAGRAVNREVAKLLDCVAVCAPRIGQEAAWAGLRRARAWRRARAEEITTKQRAFEAAMSGRPGGFELVACGAFFGWLRHPFAERTTDAVLRELVVRHDVLVMPGTGFLPDDRRMLRVSFANAETGSFGELAGRFAAAGAVAP